MGPAPGNPSSVAGIRKSEALAPAAAERSETHGATAQTVKQQMAMRRKTERRSLVFCTRMHTQCAAQIKLQKKDPAPRCDPNALPNTIRRYRRMQIPNRCVPGSG